MMARDAPLPAAFLVEHEPGVAARILEVSEQSTHRYAHLGSGAQHQLVEALKPALAPHEAATRNSHGNLVSTGAASSPEADE